MRRLLFVLGGLGLALTIGFGWQMKWAVDLWPWQESRLSYIFLASFAAAVAAPTLWIAVTREYAGLRPLALTTAVQSGGVAVTCLVVFADDPDAGTLGLAIAAAALALLAIVGFRRSRTTPAHDLRPLPDLVRWSFVAFTTILVLAGTALVLGRELFPWHLPARTSAVYGCLFLGASMYFLYAVLRPRWYEGCGQLLGFLAYDVVLIVPFLGHFDKIDSDHRTSLVIYVIAIAYSGLLAIYYLFLSPATRLTSPVTATS